jgi:hypothetical protein
MWMNGGVHFSEIASCQVEFRALGHLTGRPEYVKAVCNRDYDLSVEANMLYVCFR